MKNSNIFFWNKLEEIQKTLVAHDLRINERLDRIDTQLKLLLQKQSKDVTAELENAIKNTARMVRAIDQKVPDSPPET